MAEPTVITPWRDALGAIGDSGYRRRPVLPFGLEQIDTRMADGGLRLDALHEVAGATPDLRDDAAATLFVAGIAARAWGPVLWVVRRRDLFAPGLCQAGLAPERIVYAEAADDAELLTIMEEGLRHRGLGAVVGEARRAALPATRKLQLAAQGGRTIALLMKRHPRHAGDPLGVPSAAVTRWRVAAASSTGGIGRAHWRLTLARQQGGERFEQRVMACDETGRCALAAPVRRRKAAADAADREAA